MNKEKQNIFQRLTKLFKSGPSLRKKITTHDTVAITADKTKSSGAMLFQKSMTPTYSMMTGNAFNLAERLMRYQDFNEMESTPEIASALDIIADETVSTDENGQILHVFSEDEKIKESLEDLYYNVMNVEFNLRPWTRNLIKYGDAFLFVDVHPEYGVLNTLPVPINEIEREEFFDKQDPYAVRFNWVSMGNRKVENWEMLHFRLLGNDMFLPYGNSMIDAARRIWRQLILMEDAMLVYRVVRAPERRVFYFDVGNTPPEDIPHYVEESRARLRSAFVQDTSNNRVDLRYNPLPIHKDTPIPLLDGTTMSIEQISKKMESDQSWSPSVYSVQDETQQVVPGKVVWCGKNYTAQTLVKVWLDNDTYVMTAPEHPFVMRDGSSRRADELTSGDRLMPLNTSISTKEDGFDIIGYPTVYCPGTNKWSFLHRIVANDVLKEQKFHAIKNVDWNKNKHLVIHHKNGNKLDARSVNLEWKGDIDHIVQHCVDGATRLTRYNKSEQKRLKTIEDNKKYKKAQKMGEVYNSSELHKQHNTIRREAQIKSWLIDREKRVAGIKKHRVWQLPDEVFAKICDIVREHPKWGRRKVHNELMSDPSIVQAVEQSCRVEYRKKQFNYSTWQNDLKYRGYKGLIGLKNVICYMNHSVIKTETITVEGEDVYCMTVVSHDGKHDRHNFGVCGIGLDGSSRPSVFVKNSIDEDFVVPVRGSDTGTKIDTLAGGVNTAAIEDVEYLQKKLFSALKIPKAYLGYDEALSSKSTLSQEDVRFSRTISSIQKVLIAELNKLAIIHLYVKGYEGKDLLNFSLKLTNPSTIAQQQKLELWRTKFDIAGGAPETLLSRRFTRKNVLGLSDKEIYEIDSELIEEAEFSARLEAAGADLAAGGGTGGGGLGGGFDTSGGGGDDLFGGDEGGSDVDLSGGDEPPPEEPAEEPIEAGNLPIDEEEPELELLTSSDDPEEDLIPEIDEPHKPVKVADRLKRDKYNAKRRQSARRAKSGLADVGMPALSKMVGYNKNDSINDPDDRNFWRNPLGENKVISANRPLLTNDMTSMLMRMSERLNIKNNIHYRDSNGNILTENNEFDVQEQIDSVVVDDFSAFIEVDDDNDS